MRYCLLFVSMLIAQNANAACRSDAVQAGDVCIDKYEASVWTATAPESVSALKDLAASGEATFSQITAISGAVQVGAGASDNYGSGCPTSGNGCKNYFAFSVPGVAPSRFLSWYRALAVCRNSTKTVP